MASTVTVHRSVVVHVDDGFREGFRSLLRQVVPDAARDGAMRVPARELRRVGAGSGMGRAIGVAFEGDGGHGDDGSGGELPFQIVVTWFAVGHAEPPSVVVDHDGHVVWVVEGRGAP